MVTYTGQVTNTSTTDKNDRVLLKVVTDTGNVRCSFHSVGKSYSGNLTKSRVRLLGGGSGYLGANASLLRCAKIRCLVLKSVKSLLKRGSLGLVRLVGTAFLNELIKGWHDFPPSLQYSVYLYERKTTYYILKFCIGIFNEIYCIAVKRAQLPYFRILHPILSS